MEEFLMDWPKKSREAANRMTKTYGTPDEVTDTMLVWYNNGPWKKTIISREEVPHRFPKPHSDVLEQTIDYKVPPEKFDDLARYDGSVILERTKGTMSARCDREVANFLALNLAHDIINDRRSVEDARTAYGEKIKVFMQNEIDPYMEKLRFSLPTGDTGDPDESVITVSNHNTG
jgi:hypothetical protein